MISLNNISKSYKGRVILDNVSYTFSEGKTTAIIAPSGSGKTVLLRIIAGIEKPDSGTVTNETSKISYMFQDDLLIESFGPVKNIKLVTGSAYTKEQITEELTKLGLGDEINKKCSTFSGGMKRRVALIRALCYDADLILLDEPFKGLDPDIKQVAVDYIKQKTEGKTVIFVTHDIEDTKLLCAEIAPITFKQ